MYMHILRVPFLADIHHMCTVCVARCSSLSVVVAWQVQVMSHKKSMNSVAASMNSARRMKNSTGGNVQKINRHTVAMTSCLTANWVS